MTNPLLRSLLNLWGGNKTTVLLAAPSGTNDSDGNPQAAPVSAEHPLPVTVIGGSGGTTSASPAYLNPTRTTGISSQNTPTTATNGDPIDIWHTTNVSQLGAGPFYYTDTAGQFHPLTEAPDYPSANHYNSDGNELYFSVPQGTAVKSLSLGTGPVIGVKDDEVLTRLASLESLQVEIRDQLYQLASDNQLLLIKAAVLSLKLPTLVRLQETISLDAGVTAVALTPPAGAGFVTIQPQGTDIRIKVDNGTALTKTSGMLFYEGEREKFACISNIHVISASAAGSVEVIWWGS